MARRHSRATADQTAQQLAKNLTQVVDAMVAAAARTTAASASEPGTALAVREKTVPATSAESVEYRMGVRSGLRSAAHRNRQALYPWAIAAGLCAAGHLAWLVGWGNDQTRPVTAVVAVAAVIAVVVVTVRSRRRRSRLLPEGWAPWAALATVNGLAWLILTVAYGPSYGRLVWLVVATAVFGLRWWAHVRRPYPTNGRDPREPVGRPARAVVVEPPITRSELVDRWNKYLSRPGGPLPGSTVDDDVRPIEHGLVATIRLVPGKQSLQTVQQALPLIGTALDSYPEDTIVERHPSGPPSMLQLTVVTSPAVAETVFFDQPVYDNGKILLGPYRDGVGNAQVELYGPDSMYNGFILGSPGSGKSRILESVALSAIAQGNTVIVYLDGQRGASSPLLWKHAIWRGGPEDVLEMMAGLEGMMRFRALYLRYMGMKTGTVGFTPRREFPGIMVIVDECHRIWNKQTVEWWSFAAREWRKVGGGIWAATQAAVLKDAFAGSDVLRTSLVSGNGIALRTLSDVQQNVFPGLKVNLAGLPKGGGHGYTVDDGDQGRTRTAPFRGRFLVGQAAVDERQVAMPRRLLTAEQWFERVARLQRLDARTGAAGGQPYADRLEKAAREQAELEQMFAGGEMPDFAARFTVPGTSAPAALEDATNAGGDGDARVIQFPRFTAPTSTATLERPATRAAVIDQQPRKPEQLSVAQSRVWDVIAAGKGRPAEIAAILTISTAAVHKHLAQLLADGHIRRAEHGTYVPAR